MMNINDLPDDCIILILNGCQLPLQGLICLRSVCKRWMFIIIQQICYRKRTLKIFGSVESDLITYCNFLLDHNLEANDRYRLKSIGKDDDMIVRVDCEHNYLCDLFPFIENLVVYLTRFSSRMFNMPYLLENLSCLSSLTLIYMPYPIDLQHQVWSSINSMTLKELNLFYIFQCTIPDDMPCLAKLESFSLDGYYGDIVSLLRQLGPNLKRLHLDDIHCSVEELQQALAANSGFSRNLTHLTIGSINNVKPMLNNRSKKIFDLICSHFRSLKYLAFTSYSTYTLEEVFSSLCRLSELTELHLPYNWYSSPQSGEMLSSLISENQQHKSVKVLHLAFSPSSDANANEFPQIDVQGIFPNTEELIVSGNGQLLANAKDFLEQYDYKGLCKVKYCLKSDEVAVHVGRHTERYQKYVSELQKSYTSV